MALTNSQYEAIIKDYEHTRDDNRYQLESRKEHIYQTIPEYWDLEESIGMQSASAAKAMLSGDDSAAKKLHDDLALIREKQKQLLLSAGYPTDYLTVQYRCPLCQDTGYILAQDNQRKKCSCFRRQEISVMYAQSNIQDMISKENFSTLSYGYYQGQDLQRFENAVQLCKDFVQNFEQDYHNIIFYGTVGTGKSFLSGCIAKELLDMGHSVIYFSATGFFDMLARYSFDSKEKGALQEFYEDIYNCDLLIIDDLGTEVTNSFVASQLFSCLSERILRKKAMIISTNLSLEELRDRYSDRIFSRITSSFTLCKLTGQDIRIAKKRFPGTSAN